MDVRISSNRSNVRTNVQSRAEIEPSRARVPYSAEMRIASDHNAAHWCASQVTWPLPGRLRLPSLTAPEDHDRPRRPIRPGAMRQSSLGTRHADYCETIQGYTLCLGSEINWTLPGPISVSAESSTAELVHALSKAPRTSQIQRPGFDGAGLKAAFTHQAVVEPTELRGGASPAVGAQQSFLDHWGLPGRCRGPIVEAGAR